jgi:O-antigen/teichoic acid export membrane protein
MAGLACAASVLRTCRHCPEEFRPTSDAMITETPQAEPVTPVAKTPHESGSHLRSDVGLSIRNALKLGMGLLGSWAVALGIRLALPRFLGIAPFGEFQFADSFTTAAFILMGLGVETYTRREIATRREHASEYLGGTLLLSTVIAAVVMLVSLVALRAAGKTDRVLTLVFILGIAQMLTNTNLLFAALLHSVGEVNELSALNVVSKLMYGAGITIALVSGYGVVGVAFAMLMSESLRFFSLGFLARKHVRLRFRVDAVALRKVLIASFPFFLGAVAQTMYSRVDISIMSFVTTDTEVGWYGAASTLAGISLLLSPLISWVLLPLTTRAALRSEAELMLVSRRAMELILVVAFPVSLFLGVGADYLITGAFGKAFAPAEMSLRILAPTFILTYASIVTATLLIRLERGWAVTWVSVAGMVLAPSLNLWLVPLCYAKFGAGGAGIGAAISLTGTELFTTGTMCYLLGKHAFDRRLVVALLKTFLIGAIVVGGDFVMMGWHIGIWRLLIDGVFYFGAVTLTGALDVRGGLALARSAIASRGNRGAKGAEA